MSIEGAILSRATTHAGLSALISSRCYALRLPQNATYPALTFQRISSDREHAMGVDANPTSARYQLTIWDDDYAGARSAAEQVFAAFDRWSGTVDSTVITDSLRAGDQEFWEDQVYMVPIDYRIFYEE